MMLIDANALVLLIIGLIDQELISSHKRTSTYTKDDYENLLLIIKDFHNLVVLPNVWTEVDNLLNRFPGERKWAYIERIKELTTQTTEKFLTTKRGVNSEYFMSVGLTDSLLVELGKECDLFITADTFLSDIAVAHGIKVYDLVRARTENLRQ